MCRPQSPETTNKHSRSAPLDKHGVCDQYAAATAYSKRAADLDRTVDTLARTDDPAIGHTVDIHVDAQRVFAHSAHISGVQWVFNKNPGAYAFVVIYCTKVKTASQITQSSTGIIIMLE